MQFPGQSKDLTEKEGHHITMIQLEEEKNRILDLIRSVKIC